MEKEKREQEKDISRCPIPYDLFQEEILWRLPIKPLCRFKCVSKSWCSLIEKDPVFIEKVRPKTLFQWQIEHNRGLRIYSIDREGFATPTRGYSFKTNCRWGVWNSRHCNGLVCFYTGNAGNSKLCVFNLTTKEWIKLPHPPPRYSKCYNKFEFRFDSFEFGFCPMLNKYKVLGWSNETPSDAMVITIESHSSWRPVKDTPELAFMDTSDTSVNGTIFWFDNVAKPIISFNLANEEFNRVNLPKDINARDYAYFLFDFDGSLCLVEESRTKPKPGRWQIEIVNLWMLKDIVNSVWVTMRMKNKLIPLPDTEKRDGYYIITDYTAQNGEILIAAFAGKARHIFSYSFLNGQFRMVRLRRVPCTDVSTKIHVENHVSFKEIVWEK